MDNCIKHEGKASHYQNEAAGRYMHVWLTPIGALAVITTDCDTEYCLNVEHMVIRQPKRLNYPAGVCVYCGLPGYTRDHIMPLAWTGAAARRGVLTVPACSECNSFISDAYAPSITERRAIAQASIRRRYRRVLGRVDYTEDELDEFEGMLRVAVLEGLEEKSITLERLEWPPVGFDARALDGTGLDASESGLIVPDTN